MKTSLNLNDKAKPVGREDWRRVARVIQKDALQRVDGTVGAARRLHMVVRLKGCEALIEPLLEHNVRVVHPRDFILRERAAVVWLIPEQEPLDIRK